MGRVDHRGNTFLDEIIGEASSAAETARAHWSRLWRGRFGAPGQRHNDFEIRAPGQTLGQLPRFRRTAKNKDA